MTCGAALLVALICAVDPTETAEARVLVRNAKAAFDAGQFEQAATLLEQAAALAPTPATLYNLGRAREKAGQLEGAVAAYRRYLAVAPSTNDRGSIEATLDDLTHRIEERQRLSTLEKQPPRIVEVPVPAPSNVRFTTVAPWVLAALGLVCVGIAAGFGEAAAGSNGKAKTDLDVDAALAFADQQHAQGQALGANIAYVSGGIVLGVALLLIVLGHVLGGHGE